MSVTNSPAFLAKYDSAGNLLWAQPAPVGDAVAFGPGGSVLLTGAPWTGPSTPGVLAKYDGAGNLLWSRQFPHALAITVDGAENIYATGYGAGNYGDQTDAYLSTLGRAALSETRKIPIRFAPI